MLGEALHVRRFRLRMSAHPADIITQIIGDDEEDIWLPRGADTALFRGLRRGLKQRGQQAEEQEEE
jgi:hypothetical protein